MDERELVREVRHARDARGSSTTDRRDNAARARAGSFGRAALSQVRARRRENQAVGGEALAMPRKY